MSKSKLDAGIIQVLLERLNKQRLPRLLALKEQVDKNEPLSDFDLEFLTEAMTDANKILPMLEKNPEYEFIVTHVIKLYHDITEKALKIETTDIK
ncbi:MAG: hypothetical protein ACC653_12630 [Gammaproteobacteria bacterium]